MEPAEVVRFAEEALGEWHKERRRLDRVDRWARWDHDSPHKPRHATREYQELADRAPEPWGALIVTAVAQTLRVDGYRRPDSPDDSTGWDQWQRNGFDARQVPLHRAALTYGLAYATVMPGVDPITKETGARIRGVSPREMLALYDDVADDDWPVAALHLRKRGNVWKLYLYDEVARHELDASNLAPGGARPVYREAVQHPAGVCPVVRFANRMDLEGRSAGEVEPFIPLLGRIDQTNFDRLVVQRFASWVVRTIAGMSVVESVNALGVETAEAAKMRLRAEDILIAEDPEARFGSLPASDLGGFIKAKESDLTGLAAVSQTPAFELLGQMANMSAEALAAAKASQTAKSDETKLGFGESHEQTIRLACHIIGDADGAADFRSQVRWADTSIRSLAQAVDALGKMAQMLGFPAELLWSKVPGITQLDIDEAKLRLADAGGLDGLMRQIEAGLEPAPAPAPAPEPTPALNGA
jgi:hypothetical protein